MVICNIIINEKMDDKVSHYKGVSFVNIVDKHWKLVPKLPTLIYGHQFATSLYPREVKENNYAYYIRENLFWTYSEKERNGKKFLDNWIDEHVKCSVAKHLRSRNNPIDVLFNDFDLLSFINKVGDFPLIHAGKYEIYVAEKDEIGDVIVHSFQMDNLKYADIDPETFFYDLLSGFKSECVVFTTDEIDLTRLDSPPISFQDLIQASENTIITFSEIVNTFSSYCDQFTKEMLLTYFMRHKLYSNQLFKNFI